MDRVNRLLWASCLCIFWGLAGVVVETVSEGTQITPRGLPGDSTPLREPSRDA